VTYSETRPTIYDQPEEFWSLKGERFKANYYEVVTGEGILNI
jgi:hypothetical protein